MKEGVPSAASSEFGQKVGRGFDATSDAAAARGGRTARLKEELWEDVREKFESLLQGVALGGASAAGGGGGGGGAHSSTPSGESTKSGDGNAAHPIQFDMRESKGGLLRFDPHGPLSNLTVALTSFDSREWATDVTMEMVQECDILAASDVFDRWVLESMMQHCTVRVFRRDLHS
jgi:hypothetical protein